MGDESEPVSASKAGGLIPFFFYDVIGRILPGAFLIVCVLIALRGGRSLYSWPSLLQSVFPKDSSGGYSAVVVLLFFGTAAFLGLMLGSLSHVVEGPWQRWISPLNLCGLSKYTGASDLEKLKLRFRTQFGSELTDENLNDVSFLALYHVWNADPNLGAMSSRIDSEHLAARSCILVSLVSTLYAWLGLAIRCFRSDTPADWVWAVSILFILIGSGITFDYSRKRRLYGRFQLFLVTLARKER